MKVLLFTNYGSDTRTPKMIEIMNKNGGYTIKGRTGEVIEYIESNCVEYEQISNDNIIEIKQKMRENHELIFTFKNFQGKYYAYNSNTHDSDSFSIVDVDITRPWTIEDYDGSEGIKYLDEWTLVDKEMNYYKEGKY